MAAASEPTQRQEFAKRGWAPPTKWNDLFRPELCGRVGISHPNVSYGLFTLIMLGGGDPAKVGDGIAKMAANKKCFPVLEPSAAKLDEKIQLGEYLMGVHGSVRVISLMQKGAPIKFVVPEEGTIAAATALSPVKNSAHPKLVQEFCNWILRPESQLLLMQKAFYSPTNTTVTIPRERHEMGVPSAATVVNRSIFVSDKTIYDNRRAWIRELERAMG